MKKTRVKLIVKEFYKQMNPDMWDGSGERPDSFDTHAWEYPLTDAVHLELAFGYDESDGGWKYFCSERCMEHHQKTTMKKKEFRYSCSAGQRNGIEKNSDEVPKLD